MVTYLSESYIDGVLQHLRREPVQLDPDGEVPPTTGIDRRRDALMELVHRGVAEIDDMQVVRVKRAKTPDVPRSYEVTPAMEALRARRKALDR